MRRHVLQASPVAAALPSSPPEVRPEAAEKLVAIVLARLPWRKAVAAKLKDPMRVLLAGPAALKEDVRPVVGARLKQGRLSVVRRNQTCHISRRPADTRPEQ